MGVNKAAGCLVGVVALAAALAAGTSAAGPAMAASCDDPGKRVYVGGVAGFDSLGDPSASARLRATGRVGLYMHFNALVPALAAGRLAPVYDAFRPAGNGVAEFGYSFLTNPQFVNEQFRAFFTGLGQAPWAALLNAPDNFVTASTQTVAQWEGMAATAHRLGIRMIVPITAPNDNVGVNEDPAVHPSFGLMRAVAQAMGGVAIDGPPAYFLHNNALAVPYRAWLVRWVHWAAGMGLRVFWIVSPDTSGAEFLSDTQTMVAYLKAHDALPHTWIVENYDSFTTLDRAEVVAGGDGYTRATGHVSAPAAADGVPATVQVRLGAGHVVGVDVVDPGAGYLSATITIEGDGHGAAARAHVVPRQGERPAGTPVPGDLRQPNPNIVGRDGAAQSVAAVGLWMARNAPVRPLPPGTANPAESVCGP